MNGIRPIMSTGIPELNPPVLPMDPMAVDKVYVLILHTMIIMMLIIVMLIMIIIIIVIDTMIIFSRFPSPLRQFNWSSSTSTFVDSKSLTFAKAMSIKIKGSDHHHCHCQYNLLSSFRKWNVVLFVPELKVEGEQIHLQLILSIIIRNIFSTYPKIRYLFNIARNILLET